MNKQETEEFYPETKQHLRDWLQKNHMSKRSVWLVFYTKSSKKRPFFGVMLLMKHYVLAG